MSVAKKEAKKRESEFILPIRIDDTKIFGIHEDIAYLDIRNEGVDGIVEVILDKLNLKRKEIKSGLFVTTLGTNFNDLLEKKIITNEDTNNYAITCDMLERNLKERLYKSFPKKFCQTEESFRSGETLSVRIAYHWDLSEGLPNFGFIENWDFLEFRPIEEVYPDDDKIRSAIYEECLESDDTMFPHKESPTSSNR